MKHDDIFWIANNALLCSILVDRKDKKYPKISFFKKDITFPSQKTWLSQCQNSADFLILFKNKKIQKLLKNVQVYYPKEYQYAIQFIGELNNNSSNYQETIYALEKHEDRFLKRIKIRNTQASDIALKIQNPAKNEKEYTIAGNSELDLFFQISLTQSETLVFEAINTDAEFFEILNHTSKETTHYSFKNLVLDHLFLISKSHLSNQFGSSIQLSVSGVQNSPNNIFDSAAVAKGLVVSGRFEKARFMLDNILSMIASNTPQFAAKECGMLFTTLRLYIDWTADLSIAEQHWPTIREIASTMKSPEVYDQDFCFLQSRIDFWGYGSAEGIEPGFELIDQFFVSHGLNRLAYLAAILGYEKDARNWAEFAGIIKDAILKNMQAGFIQSDYFIKRKKLNGKIQLNRKNSEAAEDVTYLNPDISTVYPIITEFIKPNGSLATNTLMQCDILWNQYWENGGYGRFDTGSEKSTTGPWLYANLLAARAFFENGDDQNVWQILNWLQKFDAFQTGNWIDFYGEQKNDNTSWIKPIFWSELQMLAVHHFLGVRPSWNQLHLRPRLIDNLVQASASIRLRNIKLELNMQFAGDLDEPGFWVESKYFPFSEYGIVMDFPETDTVVDVIFPQKSALHKGMEYKIFD